MIVFFMGSFSDFPAAKKGLTLLKRSGVPFQAYVLSAHRTPNELVSALRNMKDAKVFIAAAGSAAHLAGVIAAHTVRPVIGVPMSSGKLNGLDALLSTVQMPAGVPVATVAVDNAENAVHLALQILAVADDDLRNKLLKQREEMKSRVFSQNEELEQAIHEL